MMFGNQNHAMIPTYPPECIQNYITTDWWIKDDSKKCCRGRLLRAYVPYVDQVPYMLVPKGRKEATIHTLAECDIKPVNATNIPKETTLPVAGITTFKNEVKSIYRAKRRPVLVLAEAGSKVEKKLREGQANYQTAPTHIVAPYFGADQDGNRGGYKKEFVERIQLLEYWQFFYDKLPLETVEESILRIDQMQPIGAESTSYEILPWRLSDEAMAIMDEWLNWAITGELKFVEEEGHILGYIRAENLGYSLDDE